MEELFGELKKRMFDLPGTEVGHKQLIACDIGHFDFPGNQVAREVSDWFDRYPRPVRP